MDRQRLAEAVALFGKPRLPGMVGRNRIGVVRVDDSALHQIDGGVVEIVEKPVVVEVVLGPAQPGRPEDGLAGDALVLEVVDRIDHALPVHAEAGIDLVEKHRDEAGLPVVAVDDVRPLVALEQELHRRLAEEGKAQRIVLKAVEGTAEKEVVLTVRLDEVALAALHEAEPDRARHARTMPGHPQVLPNLVESPDFVIPHAVVLGQDDLDRMASNLEFAAEAENHVGKSPDLGHRSQLRRNHHDVHGRPSVGVAALS